MAASRQALPLSPAQLRCIDYSGGAWQSSDDQGSLSSQKILGMTGWNQDARENRLAILALQVQCSRDGRVTQTALGTVAEWRHPSKATALQVADLRDGRFTCIAGCSDGSLYRLQLAMPQYLSADLADMQLVGDDTDGRDLLIWQQHVHRGPVADLDIRGDTSQVVTAGLDGAIHILPSDSQRTSSSQAASSTKAVNGSHAHAAHVKGSPTVSYRAVKWASPNTFIAAGTSGGVEVWDKRAKGLRPSSRSPASYGLTGCGSHDARAGLLRQIHCLDCHPGQPHLCATGASQGAVAVWDLRFGAAPLCGQLGDAAAAGEVWEVRFDVSPGGSGSVLFCTDDGSLGSLPIAHPSSASGLNSNPAAAAVSHPDDDLLMEDASTLPGSQQIKVAKPVPADVVYQEQYASVMTFDTEAADSRDVFCATDQDCLVYIHRGQTQG